MYLALIRITFVKWGPWLIVASWCVYLCFCTLSRSDSTLRNQNNGLCFDFHSLRQKTDLFFSPDSLNASSCQKGEMERQRIKVRLCTDYFVLGKPIDSPVWCVRSNGASFSVSTILYSCTNIYIYIVTYYSLKLQETSNCEICSQIKKRITLLCSHSHYVLNFITFTCCYHGWFWIKYGLILVDEFINLVVKEWQLVSCNVQHIMRRSFVQTDAR